jgi:uroporphyrinogen-III synthase
MMNDLQGLHILVTRPEPQGAELCRLIAAEGGYPVSFPTIAFAPPPDQETFQESINALGKQDLLIFISPQAVYSSIASIRKTWPQFPESVQFAAVGAGTAKALRDAGYNVTLQPESEWSSQGLLEMEELKAVSGKKIAIIRGVGGRELLDVELARRGACILPVIAYERTLPKIDVDPCLNLLEKRIIDIIICTSYEGVRNLKILLGEAGWPYIKDIPVIVMSERIKSLAHNLGFQTIWVTPNPSMAAILDVCRNRNDHR